MTAEEKGLRLKWLIVLRQKKPITDRQIKAFEQDVKKVKHLTNH